jgi:hypothetical protein
MNRRVLFVYSLLRIASRRWYTQFSTEGANERFRDFSMTGHGRTLSGPRVFPDAVAASFADKLAAVRLQMVDEIAAFHRVGAATVMETYWPVWSAK